MADFILDNKGAKINVLHNLAATSLQPEDAIEIYAAITANETNIGQNADDISALKTGKADAVDFTAHKEETAAAADGAHGLRYDGEELQYFDGEAWITIQTSGAALSYRKTFDAAADWTPASGYHTITIPAQTHGCGTEVTATVFRLINNGYEITTGAPTKGYTVRVEPNGDVTLAAGTPFAGRIVLM
ncbi:MAG: hypothetical protein FWE82_07240 [Defluviitaleaceae bacterium]|nr:hypothetical protein [Defluviitaleaceae bacterium]